MPPAAFLLEQPVMAEMKQLPAGPKRQARWNTAPDKNRLFQAVFEIRRNL